MKSKTTTREYDADGKLTKETIVEQDSNDVRWMNVGCTCNFYGHSTFAYCPVHGYRYPVTTTTTVPTITVNTAAGMSARDVRAAVNTHVRSSSSR